MKFFGEFLVERSLITEEQLLQALLEQMEALPNLANLIAREKMLPASEILLILAHQFRTKCDFRVACRALGKWTPQLESAVIEKLEVQRTPIGEILLRLGHLTMEQLTKALQEYMASGEALSETNRKSTINFESELFQFLLPKPQREQFAEQLKVLEQIPVEGREPIRNRIQQFQQRWTSAFLISGGQIPAEFSQRWISARVDDWAGFCQQAQSFWTAVQSLTKGSSGTGERE